MLLAVLSDHILVIINATVRLIKHRNSQSESSSHISSSVSSV